ncbi:MAG: hypothetical protein HY064_11930 [Bacteroidetes bacterium]|nr:hypothetical protein [Bacteroidota bacterium]
MRTKTKLFFLVFIFCGFASAIFAQPNAANGKLVQMKHADQLIGDKNKGYQRLVGNVQFEHQGVLMTCDSSHFFLQKNTLEAFSRVHIHQGDSINIFGDHLNYDGNTRKADLTGNVIMIDHDMTLTTDAITYDMNSKVASYSNGGTIVNENNTLTSDIGSYSTTDKMLTFKKNVLLDNPEYTMKCDTLKYFPVSKTAYFLGPTTIVATNNSNTIYCENGFYDTNADICQFQKNAVIVTHDQTLKGDSIWYNRKTGIGKAMKNVEIQDTSQDVTIRGDLAVHNELTNISWVTGHALYIQSFTDDSLFLHADTLKSITLLKQKAYQKKNKTEKRDTTSNDSGRVVLAYHHVRFYKTDMQGRCDSLGWTSMDSTMRLYGDPVIWSDENQITAEKISILISKGNILRMNMDNLAFIVSKVDTSRYNQIKAKKMIGYFRKNQLYCIDATGNGQTLYYIEEDSAITGINRVDCISFRINLEDQKVNSISFYSKPDGTMYPPDEMDPKEALLKGFRWRENEKPISVAELFLK